MIIFLRFLIIKNTINNRSNALIYKDIPIKDNNEINKVDSQIKQLLTDSRNEIGIHFFMKYTGNIIKVISIYANK